MGRFSHCGACRAGLQGKNKIKIRVKTETEIKIGIYSADL